MKKKKEFKKRITIWLLKNLISPKFIKEIDEASYDTEREYPLSLGVG